MQILITGGTGFIGTRLTLACLKDGHQVRVLGQENTEAESTNSNALRSAGAEMVLASIIDSDLASLVSGVDVVFHLAAAQHEANVGDDHFKNVNVEGTRRLLDACIDSGVQRFVLGSTIGVYGILDGLIDENSPCNPDNIYGETKLEGERLVLSYIDRLPVTAIRISETYGPGDRRLLKLFKTIKKGVFFIVGNGKNLHHLIYVDDLVRGIRMAGEVPAAVGEVFVLSGKEPVSTRAMADAVAAAVDGKVPKLHAPMAPFMFAAVTMETLLKPLGIQPPLHRRRMDYFKKSFTLSRDKSRNVLGFEPETGFDEGVKLTAQWYQSNGLLD